MALVESQMDNALKRVDPRLRAEQDEAWGAYSRAAQQLHRAPDNVKPERTKESLRLYDAAREVDRRVEAAAVRLHESGALENMTPGEADSVAAKVNRGLGRGRKAA